MAETSINLIITTCSGVVSKSKAPMTTQTKLPIRSRVVAVQRIGSSYQRITLGGPDLSLIPENRCGGHLKLLFPKQPSATPRIDRIDEHWRKHFLTRTLTLRNHRPAQMEIDIDIALHDQSVGPAGNWARNTTLGDEIFMTLPSEKKIKHLSAPWHLFIADPCAIPAALAAMEDVHEGSPIYGVFEIRSDQDKSLFQHIKNIESRWIPAPIRCPEPVNIERYISQLESLKLPDSLPNIFVAGEASIIKGLNSWVQAKWNGTLIHPYISPYWKTKLDQDEHKRFKSTAKSPPVIHTRPIAHKISGLARNLAQ